MNENSPEELRHQLEQHKAELTERVNRIKADAGRGLEADSAEQATQLENRDVLDALANEATEELAKINAALQRMDVGSYGVCVECGDSIQAARLEARPYASRCIRCARADQLA
jgi:RNA polymerase-binding protein DksA